jgi:hypothetical protein
MLTVNVHDVQWTFIGHQVFETIIIFYRYCQIGYYQINSISYEVRVTQTSAYQAAKLGPLSWEMNNSFVERCLAYIIISIKLIMPSVSYTFYIPFYFLFIILAKWQYIDQYLNSPFFWLRVITILYQRYRYGQPSKKNIDSDYSYYSFIQNI